MEKLDQLVDQLIKQYTSQVRPLLESELANAVEDKDNQIRFVTRDVKSPQNYLIPLKTRL